MTKTRKHNKRNKSNKRNKRRTKTGKTSKIKIIKSKTPRDVERISLVISNSLKHKHGEHDLAKGIKDPIQGLKSSYAPTINEQLVSLKSIPREKIGDCNNEYAFKLREPLKIAIPGSMYGKYCFKYTEPEAKKFLLHNQTANKHINPSSVVPPIQMQSN